MTNTIDDAVGSLTGILENTTRRATQPEAMNADALATKAIENQEGLLRKQKADAVIAIMNHPRMANIFLNMESKEL